ncbi:hypothetical protein [Sciscionella sediminilitoris]|uniref:hypothetical protein n=1 Tax=Sciscionella sediminilitoris TaxID=1445613 RepID=UPI0004DFB951|nr:hypothetical protein [Sciscionella sp. SE31]
MTGRRAALPGAAELFRSTHASRQNAERATAPAPEPSGKKTTGRERHSAKITVYISDEELLALEQARLALRATHRLAVDRGRIVREAVAVMLEDFDDRGAESVLVRRLGGETERP